MTGRGDGETHACDIAVIGGGLGGVAAALCACRWGRRVCLTESTSWLGGQATSQGVSALDEHDLIETCGATATYHAWRQAIRDLYRTRYRLGPVALAASSFNPGDAWVSRLCFEPAVGVLALVGLLLPEVEAGRLEIIYRTRPVAVRRQGDGIGAVVVEEPEGRRHRIVAARVLDATELGDLLPLADVPWVTGAEARDTTGEPDARADGPAPHLTQAFTVPFVVDRRPGEDHTIPEPPGYREMRLGQPFTMGGWQGTRQTTLGLFDASGALPGPLWTCRRLLAAAQFEAGAVPVDLSLILWPGNDCRAGDLVGASAARRQQLVAAARNLSLGLLHWLQTEAPRDDGHGRGYPELRLRTDVLGTDDGLSMRPYVREARRILARTTPRQQDLAVECNRGVRAAGFHDSCGVGWHAIDLLGRPEEAAASGPTRPFQVPLGALIPRPGAGAVNLLAAGKTIGTTHITSSCYRAHPVAWGIGEAAGALAAHSLDEGCTPAAVHDDPVRLRRLQRRLAGSGVPLYWWSDVLLEDDAFVATQMLAVAGVWVGEAGSLLFRPHEPLTPGQRQSLLEATGVSEDVMPPDATRATVARALEARLGQSG